MIYNIEVDTAENGAIAVQMYRQSAQKICQCDNRAYRLILMDLNMPVMDGIEATTQILRIMPRTSNGQKDMTHIIALSSYTNEKTKLKCHEVGMKDFY